MQTQSWEEILATTDTPAKETFTHERRQPENRPERDRLDNAKTWEKSQIRYMEGLGFVEVVK